MNDNRKPRRFEDSRPRRNEERRPRRFEEKPMEEENEGQIEGRNALTEALRSGRTIDKVFIAAGETDRGLQRLAADAKEAGAVVVPVDRRKPQGFWTNSSTASLPGREPVLVTVTSQASAPVETAVFAKVV